MSLSVSNGGIGQSPAISRINRLAPEHESRNIIQKMRRAAHLVETRAGFSGQRTERRRLWNPSVPIGQTPHYPPAELSIHSLAQRISNMTTNMLEER